MTDEEFIKMKIREDELSTVKNWRSALFFFLKWLFNKYN